MNTAKKIILIAIAALPSIAIMPSCSREAGTKTVAKAKKPSAVVKANDLISKEKSSLVGIRNGPYANLNWHFDTSGGGIKQIYVMRSATGAKNRGRVATLGPNESSYKDSLPNENAYWYSIKLITVDGKSQELGPVRVEPDKAGPANYPKQSGEYDTSVTRTEDFASIQWNFPENEYKTIEIYRFPHPVTQFLRTQKGRSGRTHVMTTVERKSQSRDALPDANADYWYWFHITLKSGVIIDKGPIKAEFAN